MTFVTDVLAALRSKPAMDMLHADRIVGELRNYAGSVTSRVPPGWLVCDGTAVSRTQYAELFGVIGTTYGTGDGSTTFDLPDFRGRVQMGAGTGTGGGSNGASGTPPSGGTALTLRVVGAWAGQQETTLQANQLPLHTHQIVDPGHNHQFRYASGAGGTTSPTDLVPPHNATFSGASGTTAPASGSGTYQSGNNTTTATTTPVVSPFVVVNVLIRAFRDTPFTAPGIR